MRQDVLVFPTDIAAFAASARKPVHAVFRLDQALLARVTMTSGAYATTNE